MAMLGDEAGLARSYDSERWVWVEMGKEEGERKHDFLSVGLGINPSLRESY